MTTFAWPIRLKYGALAAAAGWVAGWLVSFPFELALAWRYVDGHLRQLPGTLFEGLAVWAVFSLLMALAGFVPLLLPLVLLLSPGWIVLRRRWLIPAAPLVATLAIDYRMGLLNPHHVRQHSEDLRGFFFTAPNFFVITFALAAVWVYIVLAQRRLSESK
jgi:hypothetical protein